MCINRIPTIFWLYIFHYTSNSNFRWRQRPALSSTGCRTSHLFLVLTSMVESWWSPTRMTWPATGHLASTHPLLMKASSAGWLQRTPAPIRLILFLLSLPALIFKSSSSGKWLNEGLDGSGTTMCLTCSCILYNQVMSNPDRRPCHNKDFLRYNNIINGADWHNVPGSTNVCFSK